jgi:imidazolonepropionase-like amidohydrolase
VTSLFQAGVTLLLGGPSSAHDAGKLRYFAGIAVSLGLPYEIALKSISSTAAEVWGLTQVGQIAVKKRADFAVWDGDPFEPSTQLSALFINGKSQSLLTRQDRLEQRYIKAASEFVVQAALADLTE